MASRLATACLAVLIMTSGFAIMTPAPADAWKPPTHLYGVWLTVQDLLDDGKFCASGVVLDEPNPRPVKRVDGKRENTCCG